MQNIDYSKKISSEKQRKNSTGGRNFLSYPIASQEKQNSFMSLVSQQNQPLSILYLFIGAVLFFTSGLIVGMKIDQKETYFSSNNEATSFRNVVTNVDKQSTEDKLPLKESFNSTKAPIKNKISSVPKDLINQPMPEQVNYIIQIGTFSPEDAKKWGRYLIRKNQYFQGRLFKTVSGKLYSGYYHDKKQVQEAIKELKTVNQKVFSEATIRKVHF